MSPDIYVKAQFELGGPGVVIFLVVLALLLALGLTAVVWWLISRAPARRQLSELPRIEHPPLQLAAETPSAPDSDTSPSVSPRGSRAVRREPV